MATIRKLERLEESLADGESLQMGKPPSWATQLVAQVGNDHARLDLPSLYWRRTGRKSSSGLSQTCSSLKRVVVTLRQGTDLVDQRSTLLHELAHWLVGTKEHHSEVFYAQAFRLFAAYGDPHYALGREHGYKPEESLAGLRLSGIDADLVDQLLAAALAKALRPRAPVVYLLLSSDGQSVMEVRTDRQLTGEERAALDAEVKAMKPQATEPPIFSVGSFGTWVSLRSGHRHAASARSPR